MNYKIVTTNSGPDVLLYRDIDENGVEMVKILAIGESKIEQSEDYFVCEAVSFESYKTAQMFIDSFTTELAIKWCEVQGITYLY